MQIVVADIGGTNARFAVADFKDYHVDGFDPGDDDTYRTSCARP